MKRNEIHAEIVRQLELPAQDVRLTKANLFEYRQGDLWFPCEYRLDKAGKLTWEPYTKPIDHEGTVEEVADKTSGPDVNAAALLAGVDPAEMYLREREGIQNALQGQGFNLNVQAVLLAVACDGLKLQKNIAQETGLDRKTVAEIMKRPRVREALAKLKSGKPLEPIPYKGTPTKGLHLVNCENHARAILLMTGTDNIGAPARRQWAHRHKLPPEVAEWPGFLRFLNSDQLTPQHVVELVKAHPPLLLYGEQQEDASARAMHKALRPLREAFVGLLLAGSYGASPFLRTSAAPQGKPRAVKAKARKMLSLLNRWPKGYAFPDEPLAEVVDFYRQRIVELRDAFGPGMTDERLAKFRKEHAYEFDGYTDRELRELLSKGNDPLKLAARYAGRVADMKPDAFLKAYRRAKPSA